MAKTVSGVVGDLRLRCPMLPALLARSMVQGAYNQACDSRRWSWLRAENEILTAAARSGTCTVTHNSATVTVGVGTHVFVAGDLDRQFQVSGPPYTIISVTPPNTLVLDRPYGGTSGLVSAKILDAYVTMPEDFGSFLVVLDPQQQWCLNIWATDEELNRTDPARQESSAPQALVPRRLGSTTATQDRIQYELWPYAQSAYRYPYFYSKRPGDLADTDYFAGVLRHRTDVILDLALAELAEWPGLEDRRNPYFNLGLAANKRKQAQTELSFLETRDEEIYLTWLNTLPHYAQERLGPMDSNWIRSHAEI